MAPEQLRGLWGFPLTPFSDDRVDLDQLGRLTSYQVDGGVDAVCACGAIAQAEVLSKAERFDCLRAVLEATAARVPVVMTLPGDGEAPETAAWAQQLGASAALVLPIASDVQDIRATLDGIRDAAPGLPVVLYHRPPLLLAPDELRELCSFAEFLGIKDGYRDVRLCRRLRCAAERPLLWLSAWEDVALAFFALGFDAFAPASTAYAPQYARAWLERLRSCDLEGASRLLEAHAYPMVDLRLSRPNIEVSVVKAALQACGLASGQTRPPAQPLTASEIVTVERLVAEMQAVLDKGALAAFE